MRRYRLDARCPRCNERPKDRYAAEAVEHARTMPAEAEYKDVLCRCGAAYRVPWGALANGEPVEPRRSAEPAPWAA